MRAFVITGPGQGAVRDIDPLSPSPGQVVVDVERAGVCGTDMEFFTGHMAYLRTGEAHYPVRIGHEWCGVVAGPGMRPPGPGSGSGSPATRCSAAGGRPWPGGGHLGGGGGRGLRAGGRGGGRGRRWVGGRPIPVLPGCRGGGGGPLGAGGRGGPRACATGGGGRRGAGGGAGARGCSPRRSRGRLAARLTAGAGRAVAAVRARPRLRRRLVPGDPAGPGFRCVP